jgi:transcription antitermination factor NusG
MRTEPQKLKAVMMRQQGVVYDYGDPPRDAHFVLSRQQFDSIRTRLVGLPIRVEHANTTVGRIVSASLVGDREVVEWELEDNAAGWAAAKLTDLNAIRELSLKHAVFADGRLDPIEVSLCERGARPGTVIVKASETSAAEASAQYKTHAAATIKERSAAATAMASPAETVAVVPPAGTPVPAQQAVQQQQQPAVEATPVTTNAVATDAAPTPVAAESAEQGGAGIKRKRLDDPMEFLKNISGKITDAEALQSIAELIGEAVEDKIANQHEVEQLRQAKALLEKAQDASKESAKTIVSDVVSVLSDLYSRFAPNVKLTEEQKSEFSSLMEQNPNALNYVRPLVVAASAMAAVQATTTTVQVHSNAALDQAIAKIGALQNQLGTAKRMNAPVAATTAVPVPQWTHAAQPAAPMVAAAPMVEVAASGNGLSRIQLPAILQGLPGYDGGVGVGRIKNDMFQRKLVSSPVPLPGPAAGSI